VKEPPSLREKLVFNRGFPEHIQALNQNYSAITIGNIRGRIVFPAGRAAAVGRNYAIFAPGLTIGWVACRPLDRPF
jgi:hypothetical protein